jgi:hypothetical protein
MASCGGQDRHYGSSDPVHSYQKEGTPQMPLLIPQGYGMLSCAVVLVRMEFELRASYLQSKCSVT